MADVGIEDVTALKNSVMLKLEAEGGFPKEFCFKAADASGGNMEVRVLMCLESRWYKTLTKFGSR